MNAPTPTTPCKPSGRFDHAEPRRAQRRGRERGCWVYISAEHLNRAGVSSDEPPPLYRTWASPTRPRVIVNLYPVKSA
jgi:hypothetical protein